MFKYPNQNVEQKHKRATGKIKKKRIWDLLIRKENCKSKLHSRRREKHFSP
jgi:hypothetical protein